MAVKAIQAFFHVNPFDVDAEGMPRAREEHLALATVGGLFINELISNSRGMVAKPMQITFIVGGAKIEPVRLEDAAAGVLTADRTGRPHGGGEPAA